MKRGPKSAADLATVIPVSNRARTHEPPIELTDAQSAVWRSTVAAMDAKFITKAAYPILIEFCRHVCRSRFLEQQVEKFQTDWLKVSGGLERLDRLMGMAERETRSMTACARTLRLTPHAQMHARTAGKLARDAKSGPRPWDPNFGEACK